MEVATRNALPTRQEIDALKRATADAIEFGNPRPFIERFLKIQTPQGIIPAKYTPTWEYYHQETFGSIKHFDEGMERLLVKARKATWTTYIKNCGFAFIYLVPAFPILSAADKVENASDYQRMLDVSFYNLPEWMQDTSLLENWSEARRSIRHVVDGEVSFSTISVGSPHSRGFGQGMTPKMLDFDEAGSYAPEYEDRLYTDALNSKIQRGAWVFYGGTPEGKKTYFYRVFQAIRHDESPAKLIVRYWYENKENYLRPGSYEALPADRGDIVIGDTSRPGGATELAVVERFPKDDVIAPESRIRWRRAHIQAAINNKKGADQLGFLDFQQEWLEDLDLCWMGGSAASVDLTAQQAMKQKVEKPFHSEMVAPGLWQHVWRRPVLGASYGGVLDPSSGLSGGDPSSFCLFDRDTGQEVAQLYGRAGAETMVRYAVELCRLYNNAVFCPLTTGNFLTTVTFAEQMGYRNIYRRAAHAGEDTYSKTFVDRPYGFNESGQQENMRTTFLSQVATGSLWSASEESQSDWFQYDWGEKKHKPERVVCAAVFSVIRYHLPPGRVQGAAAPRVQPQAPRRKRFAAPAPAGGYASRVWGA